MDGAGALEGYSEGPDTDDWTNLAFLAPDSGGEIPLGEVYRNLHYGKSTMLNIHGPSINACLVGLASAHSAYVTVIMIRLSIRIDHSVKVVLHSKMCMSAFAS